MKRVLPVFLVVTACQAVPTTELEKAEPAGSTAPISVEDRLWTWVPFEDALCADGSATGMALNRNGDETTLLLYLQGGGACWTGQDCWGPFPRAVSMSGYDYRNFQGEPNLTGILLLRRDDQNPFKDAHHAFIPYCTGDVHSGDHVTTYREGPFSSETHHVGHRNLGVFLKRLSSTFPNVTRVLLTGASAGGFGAAMNLPQVQDAFPGARVDVIDDSGPLIDPQGDTLDEMQDAWHIQVPAECTGCNGPRALQDFYVEHYPDTRFALLSYLHDAVIADYTGLSGEELEEKLRDIGTQFDGSAHRRYFFVEGSSHVVLGTPTVDVGGVTLLDWLGKLAGDDEDWRSVKP